MTTTFRSKSTPASLTLNTASTDPSAPRSALQSSFSGLHPYAPTVLRASSFSTLSMSLHDYLPSTLVMKGQDHFLSKSVYDPITIPGADANTLILLDDTDPACWIHKNAHVTEQSCALSTSSSEHMSVCSLSTPTSPTECHSEGESIFTFTFRGGCGSCGVQEDRTAFASACKSDTILDLKLEQLHAPCSPIEPQCLLSISPTFPSACLSFPMRKTSELLFRHPRRWLSGRSESVGRVRRSSFVSQKEFSWDEEEPVVVGVKRKSIDLGAVNTRLEDFGLPAIPLKRRATATEPMIRSVLREEPVPSDEEATVYVASPTVESPTLEKEMSLVYAHQTCSPQQTLRPTLYEFLTQNGIDWCRYCGTTEGVNWRPGPWGKRTLCNKHGCDYKGYGFACKLPRLNLSTFAGEQVSDRERPVLQLYCTECADQSSWVNNRLCRCDGCPRAYHQGCFAEGISDVAAQSTDPWYCTEACRENRLKKRIVIEFPRQRKLPLMNIPVKEEPYKKPPVKLTPVQPLRHYDEDEDDIRTLKMDDSSDDSDDDINQLSLYRALSCPFPR